MMSPSLDWSSTLLANKLYAPSMRTRVVVRPSLLRQLDEALVRGCALILVSAPAGFGKSTLVGEWGSGLSPAPRWLSLDEADNDPARFVMYLIAALMQFNTAGHGWDELLQQLRAPQPPPLEPLFIALLNEMALLPDG